MKTNYTAGLAKGRRGARLNSRQYREWHHKVKCYPDLLAACQIARDAFFRLTQDSFYDVAKATISDAIAKATNPKAHEDSK